MYPVRIIIKKIIKNDIIVIIFCSFCISSLFAFIHAVFVVHIVQGIVGFTLFFSGLIFYGLPYFNNKNKARTYKDKIKRITTEEITDKSNNKKTVYTVENIHTNGGNYNGKIEGNYTQRDSITDNSVNQYVTLEDNPVEVSSDISQTLSDFKDILNKTISRNSDPAEAVSNFAKELANELRKQPEIKVSFNAQEDTNEQELANKIIIDLLTKSYEQIYQITQTYPINQNSQIQKTNTTSELEFTEYYINNYESDRDTQPYKGYTIYLAKDHKNMWLFKIETGNGSYLDLSKQRQRRFSSKDMAMAKAKKIIEKDRLSNW